MLTTKYLPGSQFQASIKAMPIGILWHWWWWWLPPFEKVSPHLGLRWWHGLALMGDPWDQERNETYQGVYDRNRRIPERGSRFQCIRGRIPTAAIDLSVGALYDVPLISTLVIYESLFGIFGMNYRWKSYYVMKHLICSHQYPPNISVLINLSESIIWVDHSYQS